MTMTTAVEAETEFEARLEHRERIADGVVRLTFTRADGAELSPWEPGAHVDLVLAPGLVRQYSLCGDPVDRKRLSVAVLDVPDGRGGSRRVHEDLVEGGLVRLRGPRNHFPLRPAAEYVFVAGGIGITPILPMVAAAEASGARWRLVYGGRTRSSMAFADHLIDTYGERVLVLPQDETGLLDLDTLLPTPDTGTRVYCCGPEPLLRAVEERAANWLPDTLHVERFTPAATSNGEDQGFEVELSGGRVVGVPAGTSVLEALEEAGVPVLSSCREGTCGTCETVVLDGVPEHRDSLLSDAEREENEVMMVCVSRSRTPRLVLEL